MFISSTKERFLIPDGYKGDVYIVYGAPDGESLNKTGRAITYRIPKDGVLRVLGPMTRTWTRTEYDYQMETGNLERIRNYWPATIHPTTENLANDRDIRVFFPRTGTFTDPKGCSVEYQLFYVGTKSPPPKKKQAVGHLRVPARAIRSGASRSRSKNVVRITRLDIPRS